jgi:2'-hydroxyisoflavone reductase
MALARLFTVSEPPWQRVSTAARLSRMSEQTAERRRSIDLLVLGGTSWLGGRVAATALERGHRVSCLARGESGEAPEGAEWVRADRSDPMAYDAVADRPWDAVLDVSWQPDLVRSALAALAGRAAHWLYVSSCSVYTDDSTPAADESAAVHPPHPDSGRVDVDSYGPAKVACEQACQEAMGSAHLLVARAGLIGGYGDRSDRLGYWPARIATARDGEQVLVPPTDAGVQVIDVDDLASWIVLAAEQRIAGVFNAVGETTPLGAVLERTAAAAGTHPQLREATDQWLTEHGVAPWSGPDSLPLWLPRPEYAGFMTRSNAAALRSGLRLRPVQETLTASLRWEQEQGLDRDRRAGLRVDREQELCQVLAADPG